MRKSVGFVLGEDDAFEQVWIEVVDGGGGEFGEGDFDLGPAIGGEIADKFAEFQCARELRVCVDDANFGESAAGNCVWRVAPEKKIAADETDFAIAKTHDVDANVPAAVASGGPFEAKGVRRRVEEFCFDGKFSTNKSEGAWSGDVPGAVEVGVMFEAVVEEDVVVVEGVGECGCAEEKYECEREYIERRNFAARLG